MDQVLDQSHDLDGRELWRIKSTHPLPDFVKHASPAQLCGDDGMQPHLYAAQAERLYPLHTKAAVWASTAFLLDKRSELPPGVAARALERLEKAASFFGMRPAVEALKAKAAAQADDGTAGLSDDDFAWASADDQGNPARRLPLRNAAEVVKAADWLARYRDEFAYWDRQKIAVAILRKAAQFGAATGDHDDMLEKVAGWGGCAAKTAAALVRGRAAYLRHDFPDVSDELTRMATLIEANPAQCRNPGMLQKVAATVDTADRLAKGRTAPIAGAYSDAFPRPEDVLFALTRKRAEAASEALVVNTTGAVYDKDALATLRVRDVRDYLGDDLAAAASVDGVHADTGKLAELVPTLPLPDARVFDQLCADAGVRPFGKQAATRPRGVARADLIRLAQGR